ncbi:N-6 DNA methylase [Oscillatoria acuminata]|uniref:Type I restriction-modification system methyltransferase subunit n=1 Tax=Oscillatoria acuminata PCC 6304 TaxID=56110 RepID=K9TQZ9_9CYAN|nr:N-6 DNA methylase [Oscillatoria acuminata]AFY84434.1 type I restriction-modification system methyltransferase subunit [Oscillatoria acuminata PCC 6304]
MNLERDSKAVYRQIRNYLVGRFLGATRDETLLQETIKCLFCKLYFQQNPALFDPIHDHSNVEAIARRYHKSFAQLGLLLPTLFPPEQRLLLDSQSLAQIDTLLNTANLDTSVQDPFGEIYEVFMGSQIRGQDGQFFTPLNAIALLVTLVNPLPGERIIDPACGAGGFLSMTARHLKAAGASLQQILSTVFGLDKDHYLAGLAATRLSLLSLKSAQVFCADSLAWKRESLAPTFFTNFDKTSSNSQPLPFPTQIGEFDIVLTNPPFGSRIVAASPQVQATFELGYRWRLQKNSQSFEKLPKLQPSVPPQVLFVERCLSLVRPGGRIGMVVPESLISSKTYRYVVDYIQSKCIIKAVIGMPDVLFKISGKGGTHTKTCLLLLQKKSGKIAEDESNPSIFMAEAQWCGRDSRGQPIDRDDLPEIAAQYRDYEQGLLTKPSQLGYWMTGDRIQNGILAPHYYNPAAISELFYLQDSHDFISMGELISGGMIEVSSGDEVGKLAYGTGNIPFVRTSDISNWEIKADPKHSVSEEIYQSLVEKQDLREGDILMVRDGTYLIGTCALITADDTRILFQSHFYKLRVRETCPFCCYLLLAALSSVPVQKQILAKRLTQDIIDSLGNRIQELILPIPKDKARQEKIAQMVKQTIQHRIEARKLARQSCLELVAGCNPDLWQT